MIESNVWTSFGQFLSDEFAPYFLSSTFSKDPVFYSDRRELELAIQTEHILPYEVYEQVIIELQLKLQVSVDFKVSAKDTKLSMNELNQYVERLV